MTCRSPAFADSPAPAFTMEQLAAIRDWHTDLPAHLRVRIAAEHAHAEEMVEIRAEDDGSVLLALTRGPAGTFVAEDWWDLRAAPQLVWRLDDALEWIGDVLRVHGWMEGRPPRRPGTFFPGL
ncbi:MAG TPA: hypothetical protein VME92_21040 [Acetobacteraceae bacterium]|nr:hypothetical protein [Acetobacteraceae bacterium]